MNMLISIPDTVAAIAEKISGCTGLHIVFLDTNFNPILNFDKEVFVDGVDLTKTEPR